MATSGVIDVVRAGRDPAPVPLNEMEAIQRVVQTPLYTEPYARLVTGQRVRLSAGPLAGLTGKLMEVRRNLRLAVSVELLQRSVLVEIDRDWVEPDGSADLVSRLGGTLIGVGQGG